MTLPVTQTITTKFDLSVATPVFKLLNTTPYNTSGIDFAFVSLC